MAGELTIMTSLRTGQCVIFVGKATSKALSILTFMYSLVVDAGLSYVSLALTKEILFNMMVYSGP